MRSLFSSADIAPPHLVVVGECAGYSRVNVDAGPRLRRDSLPHEAGVSAREMFPLALDTKAVASARVAGTTASRRGCRTNPRPVRWIVLPGVGRSVKGRASPPLRGPVERPLTPGRPPGQRTPISPHPTTWRRP